jgi:hypothetical protein
MPTVLIVRLSQLFPHYFPSVRIFLLARNMMIHFNLYRALQQFLPVCSLRIWRLSSLLFH